VSARDRLLDKACDLFYREGIQAVGIQRLIDEAGIAKASLYAHFPSKDDLVAAYLERRSAEWHALVDQRVLAADVPAREKLLKIFDLQIEMAEKPGFRGCPFVNACGELADAPPRVRAVSDGHRARLKALITGLVKDAGVAHPTAVANAILVLMDGAAATAMVEGNASAPRHARWAADQLLQAAAAPRAAKPSRPPR
jgi:AcrR family transcriptional regulator